jgi:SAM-dependent methyltransferase
MSGAPNFDRLARAYRWLEYVTFGPSLQQARTRYLSELGQCERALVLGDGDGRFTACLLRANPEIQIHAVDGSPKMLQALLRSAGAHAGRVTTETADLRHWQPAPGATYDLVATHFFLDCLTTDEIWELASRVMPALTEGALWVVSDFAIPEGRLGRLYARPLVSGLYLAFRWLTGLGVRQLPDHQPALAATGWTLRDSNGLLGGLLICQLWRFSRGKAIF